MMINRGAMLSENILYYLLSFVLIVGLSKLVSDNMQWANQWLQRYQRIVDLKQIVYVIKREGVLECGSRLKTSNRVIEWREATKKIYTSQKGSFQPWLNIPFWSINHTQELCIIKFGWDKTHQYTLKAPIDLN